MSSFSIESASPVRPRLSVVVVAFSRPDLLTACLESLSRDAHDVELETLVVSDWQRPDGRPHETLRARFPVIRWIDASGDSIVPRMRAMAIKASTGEIVAIIEDDCVVRPGWCEALLAAHRTSAAAVGGAVEPGAYRRGLDWAVYFCDYGRFMLPLTPGPAVALPGNNMSYKREALERLPAELAHEFQEVFVHAAWQRDGIPMWTEPAMVVTNMHTWTRADVTVIPYHHARAFAGRRFTNQPHWRRGAMSLFALLLPGLKVFRVVKETVARGRCLGALVRALPWIVVLSTSWSMGESIGYLRGPGDSASRWR